MMHGREPPSVRSSVRRPRRLDGGSPAKRTQPVATTYTPSGCRPACDIPRAELTSASPARSAHHSAPHRSHSRAGNAGLSLRANSVATCAYTCGCARASRATALWGSAAMTAPPGPARTVIAAFCPVSSRKPPTLQPGPATKHRGVLNPFPSSPGRSRPTRTCRLPERLPLARGVTPGAVPDPCLPSGGDQYPSKLPLSTNRHAK